MTAYTIADLTWERIGIALWVAKTCFGRFYVERSYGNDDWYFCYLTEEGGRERSLCISLDDAFAKGEAYYRERLLPALVPVSPMEVIVDPVFPAEW